MRINKLEPTKAGSFILHFDDGSEAKTSYAIVSDYNLYSGCELEEDEHAELMAAISLARAKSRAADTLSRRPLSKKGLIKKLIEKGENEDDSEAAAEYMESLGAINDYEYALGIVRRCKLKGYGASRIKSEFYAHSVDRELWDEALETLDDMSGEIDRYIESRLKDPEDRKQVKKVTDALYRRGHSWDDISAGLRRFKDEDWE